MTTKGKPVNQYAKSLIAALIAALTALGTGLTDGSMSPAEWVAVALAFVVALGAVYSIPNAPAE